MVDSAQMEPDLMGWGYAVEADGREIGYMVDATCDADGCEAEIDRGLGYACGGWHGAGERCCERYFCHEHLYDHGCDWWRR